MIPGEIALRLIDNWRVGAEEWIYFEGVDNGDNGIFVDLGDCGLVGLIGHCTVDEEGVNNVRVFREKR